MKLTKCYLTVFQTLNDGKLTFTKAYIKVSKMYFEGNRLLPSSVCSVYSSHTVFNMFTVSWGKGT